MGCAMARPIQATLSNSTLAADPMTKSKPTSVYIHSRVPETVLAAVRQLAEDDDRSLSSIIRCALKEYLDSRGYSTDDA